MFHPDGGINTSGWATATNLPNKYAPFKGMYSTNVWQKQFRIRFQSAIATIVYIQIKTYIMIYDSQVLSEILMTNSIHLHCLVKPSDNAMGTPKVMPANCSQPWYWDSKTESNGFCSK